MTISLGLEDFSETEKTEGKVFEHTTIMFNNQVVKTSVTVFWTTIEIELCDESRQQAPPTYTIAEEDLFFELTYSYVMNNRNHMQSFVPWSVNEAYPDLDCGDWFIAED